MHYCTVQQRTADSHLHGIVPQLLQGILLAHKQPSDLMSIAIVCGLVNLSLGRRGRVGWKLLAHCLEEVLRHILL